MFLRADFEGVKFYTTKQYFHLTKEEESKTSLSVMKIKKTRECCQFKIYIYW